MFARFTKSYLLEVEGELRVYHISFSTTVLPSEGNTPETVRVLSEIEYRAFSVFVLDLRIVGPLCNSTIETETQLPTGRPYCWRLPFVSNR